jgi:hypothetical protein
MCILYNRGGLQISPCIIFFVVIVILNVSASP